MTHSTTGSPPCCCFCRSRCRTRSTGWRPCTAGSPSCATSREVETGAALLALADREPFAAVAFGIRAALRIPQRAIVTVTTNVPGPREQLYVLGRPIREILPYVPIAERMRIGVSVFTYGGRAAFGVTTDFASVPEADAFAADIIAEIGVLSGTVDGRTDRTGAGCRPPVARPPPGPDRLQAAGVRRGAGAQVRSSRAPNGHPASPGRHHRAVVTSAARP